MPFVVAALHWSLPPGVWISTRHYVGYYQHAGLRALIQSLKCGGLVKDPNKGAAVLEHFAAGVRHNAELTTVELGRIANSLRSLQR